MLTISKKAIDFIIAEEDCDQAYYEQHCIGFEWPGGASGATVGIGYDCGYCSPSEIQSDWDGLISDGMIAYLKKASGLTHEAAHGFVRHYRGFVRIDWETAVRQFTEREMPKWITRVENALPNCDKLSPDSLGALVSLAYNRGASFHLLGDRYTEMRAINDHMIAGEFGKIPAEIKHMARLWAKGGDLWRRRYHEAELFSAGLPVESALSI